MECRQIGWFEACRFVATYHRHHKPPRGHKFSLGAYLADQLVGVAIVGRPSSRVLQARGYLEVVRTCTYGTPNVNSFLYAACWREVHRRDVSFLCTYTQQGESGASLRGAGWIITNVRRARTGWDCPARVRHDLGHDGIERYRWEPVYR